jgi:hypothetical protein
MASEPPKFCPPGPSGEPQAICYWRIRGYNLKAQRWETYLVRASDSIGALAQGEFRWARTHKYVHVFGEPIPVSGADYPPVKD